METGLPQPRSALSGEGEGRHCLHSGISEGREPTLTPTPDATPTHTYIHMQADIQSPCSLYKADAPSSNGGLRPRLPSSPPPNRGTGQWVPAQVWLVLALTPPVGGDKAGSQMQ